MNDAVKLAREHTQKPTTYDIDLVLPLKELYNAGVLLKVRGNCMTRSKQVWIYCQIGLWSTIRF